MLTKPDLNKPVFVMFVEAKTYITNNQCPSCKNPIIESQFSSEESKKEYTCNGLCEKCQNEVYTKE